jgi:hypothetical protein
VVALRLAGLAGTNLLILFLYPTVIAPLFNKFTPLEDAALKQRIEALLARCGFASSGLFVMDGSKRSAHGNAYFTGFGRSQAHRLLRHPAGKARAAGNRGRAGARTRPLPPQARDQAHRAVGP